MLNILHLSTENAAEHAKRWNCSKMPSLNIKKHLKPSWISTKNYSCSFCLGHNCHLNLFSNLWNILQTIIQTNKAKHNLGRGKNWKPIIKQIVQMSVMASLSSCLGLSPSPFLHSWKRGDWKWLHRVRGVSANTRQGEVYVCVFTCAIQVTRLDVTFRVSGAPTSHD